MKLVTVKLFYTVWHCQ